MKIRIAEQKDIPSLLRLLRQVLAVHHKGRPDLFQAEGEKYQTHELEILLQDTKRPIFVAEEDGAVLGYAFCIYREISGSSSRMDCKTLYIDDLCVDEKQRGKQIGSRLYAHVLEVAKAAGCYNVELNVWACNESALRFYEKIGMKPQKIGMEQVL